MSTEAKFLHNHNLDISSVQNLAKDLSERLKVNVKYGFINHPERFLPLYENPLLETVTEYDGIIILETIEYPEASETLVLTEEDFLERRLYEKYGYDIIHTKEFKEEYASGSYDMTNSVLSTYREDKEIPHFSIESVGDSKYSSMYIYKHCLENSLFDYYDWRQLNNRVLSVDLDYIEYAYTFTVFRFNLLQSVLKLGGDIVYVVPFGGGDDNFEGIGEGEEWSMEWNKIQSIIERKGKGRIFNFSDTNHKRPVKITPSKKVALASPHRGLSGLP